MREGERKGPVGNCPIPVRGVRTQRNSGSADTLAHILCSQPVQPEHLASLSGNDFFSADIPHLIETFQEPRTSFPEQCRERNGEKRQREGTQKKEGSIPTTNFLVR